MREFRVLVSDILMVRRLTVNELAYAVGGSIPSRSILSLYYCTINSIDCTADVVMIVSILVYYNQLDCNKLKL